MCRRYAAKRCGSVAFAIVHVELAEGGFAQPHRLFEHRVEYWGKVTGRGIDDPQHFGGRGLLLQRLARLGQEPRVLDRDNGLVGKGTDQFDLPLGERLDLLAVQINRSEDLPLAQQGTPSMVRRPTLTASVSAKSGSARMSAICTTLPSRATRPAMLSRPGTILRWRKAAQNSGSAALCELDTAR